MDKNTITGLVLIAILLVGFSFLSRPSQEQLEAQQRYYDSIAQVQQREADLKAKAEAALANESGAEASVDSTALFFDARQGTNSQVTIQNNLHQLDLVQERIRANHISITLIELTVTSLLRAEDAYTRAFSLHIIAFINVAIMAITLLHRSCSTLP